MNKKKIKVAILYDNYNDWIKKKLNFDFISFKKKYKFKIFYDYKKIKNYDLVFILGYTKILKAGFLKKNKLNLVIHESDLPKGKGFSPVQNQIKDGKTKIKINLLKANKKPDSGIIYENLWMNIPKYKLYDEIREIQAKASKQLIIKFLKKYPFNKGIKQKGRSTYYKKLTHKDDEISIHKNIYQLFDQLRVNNYKQFPNYFFIHGKKIYLKIYKTIK